MRNASEQPRFDDRRGPRYPVGVTSVPQASILDDLNPPQREAVLHPGGPLLIIAGAGSGKTRVITRRIAHLISNGLSADQVLAITFTNKAAQEMRERTASLCVLETPWVSTFHSFCARVLRRHIHRLEPYDNSFSIYDTEDARALLKETLAELHVDAAVWTPQGAQSAISRLKNLANAETIEDSFGSNYTFGQVLREVYYRYLENLRKRNAVDFDDLLVLTVRLFHEEAEVRDSYRTQFRHLLVDEYQDTNAAQYELTRLLTGHERNICVTGDPDQSIYAWRGADLNNILHFERDFTDATTIKLEQNYRSSKNVLSIANRLIVFNEERKPKSLWTENERGDPVRIYRFESEKEEAREVASLISTLCREETRARDIAVFYRINSLSRALEEELILADVPYSIVGGVEFFLRREIKDILAYLQVVDNPRDDENLRRVINVPARGIGKTSVERLETEARRRNVPLLKVLSDPEGAGLTKRAQASTLQLGAMFERLLATRSGPVTELIELIIEETGYARFLRASYPADAEDRVDNLGELLGAGREFDDTQPDAGVTGFLEKARLLSNMDRWDRRSDRVTLMTLHGAKGLEFPVVVILGVEDGLLPLRRAGDPDTDIEEERRLLYVGITRAEKMLYLTHVSSRSRFGQRRDSVPSGFIAEIRSPRADPASEQLDALELDDETLDSLEARDRAEDWAKGSLEETDFVCDDAHGFDDVDEDPYPIGAQVEHEDYGAGTVVRSTGHGRLRRITVDFEDAGQKQLVVEYAPLKRIW